MPFIANTKKSQKQLVLICFLIVPSILLILFVLLPLFKLFQLSFTNWNGISKALTYTGIDNYKTIITSSPDVWLSLRNNALYFFIHLLFIPVEIVIAFLLDMKIKGSKIFKNIIFMPYIINGVAIACMFSAIFAPDYATGALNMMLKQMGMGQLALNWLSDPKIVNFTLVFVSLWRYAGFHMVLFLAGMQSIPGELFEAAKIDGAGSLRQLTKIVLPSIRTVTEIVLFLNVRGALQVFDIPFIMTSGGPGHASSTFSVYTIETAFKYNSVGKAAAMAVLLFFLIILISKLQDAIMGGSDDKK
jgi:raffinose/stachyose/melibiose transport system permease protein